MEISVLLSLKNVAHSFKFVFMSLKAKEKTAKLCSLLNIV